LIQNKTNEIFLIGFKPALYIVCVTILSAFPYHTSLKPISTSDMCVDMSFDEDIDAGGEEGRFHNYLLPALVALNALFVIGIALFSTCIKATKSHKERQKAKLKRKLTAT
jgi:hypothetical protein